MFFGYMTIEFILNLAINILNLMNQSEPIPNELNDIFDNDEYNKSQQALLISIGLLTAA